MRKKLFLLIKFAAAFLVPFFVASLLIQIFRTDFSNRVGYLLWLWASPEDELNYYRQGFILSLVKFLLPFLAGCAGFFWAVHRKIQAYK